MVKHVRKENVYSRYVLHGIVFQDLALLRLGMNQLNTFTFRGFVCQTFLALKWISWWWWLVCCLSNFIELRFSIFSLHWLMKFDSNCFTEVDTKPATCFTERYTKPDGGWACFETHAPNACPVSTPVDSIVDRCSIALCRSIGREYCCLLADSFDHDVGSVRSDGRRRKMCFCYLMLGSCYRACDRTKVPTYVFLDFLCVVKLQKSPFRSRVHLGQATS